MIAYLDRDYSPEGTAGTLSYNGLKFYTVERPWIDNTPYTSCIPEGIYAVRKYNSERFPDAWEVTDVGGGRTHILFHAGNRPIDVQGCIAVGLTRGNRNPLWVERSKNALDQMREVFPDEFVLVIRPFSTENHAEA